VTKSVEEGLNERQQTCLRIIYRVERASKRSPTPDEAGQRSSLTLPGWSAPKNDWRWLQYDPSHLRANPLLRQELDAVGLSGRGIKRTFDALWTRGYVLQRWQQLGRYRVLMIRLTPAGRRVARALDPAQA
jgi:hypothetical protein